jgi:hypothetical protein
MKLTKIQTEGEKITIEILWGDGSKTLETFTSDNTLAKWLEKYTINNINEKTQP